jgi:homopolymeric O-antigen transport system permease protein
MASFETKAESIEDNMIPAFQELMRYRDLLYMVTWREISVKYKQTVFGFLWAILMPLIIVSAGILVRYAFSLLSGRGLGDADVASIAIKSVPWAFFVSAIRFSSISLISNANLVTKIYFPKVIFPIAAVLSQLIDLSLASVVLLALLSVMKIGMSWQLLWVPVFLIILILFVTGLATFLSAASLFFRDVKYVVEVVLTFAIFFTPVLYEVSHLGSKGHFLLLNPVAPILEGLNSCIVYRNPPQLAWILYSGLISVVTFAFSMRVFYILQPRFAESI